MMRFHLFAILSLLASQTAAGACEIKWPNADIPVPPLVHDYIVAECHTYKDFAEENEQDCIRGERFGYQAVVTMLSDPVLGDDFAEQYRDCSAGLGDLGGRFHRRRAECMGSVAMYVWRFEFTQRASVTGRTVIVERLEPCERCTVPSARNAALEKG
jgi:hypothetical protein